MTKDLSEMKIGFNALYASPEDPWDAAALTAALQSSADRFVELLRYAELKPEDALDKSFKVTFEPFLRDHSDPSSRRLGIKIEIEPETEDLSKRLKEAEKKMLGY
jgi:hypothetical protein